LNRTSKGPDPSSIGAAQGGLWASFLEVTIGAAQGGLWASFLEVTEIWEEEGEESTHICKVLLSSLWSQAVEEVEGRSTKKQVRQQGQCAHGLVQQ
jgi:hypothetical protein